MGGNVFKHTHKVVRLSAGTYYETVRQVKTLLDGVRLGLEYHDVQAIYSKPDFGDMDLVVNTNSSDAILAHEDYLKNLGFPISRNGDVLSFLFHQFQIDLLFIPEESFSYACNYFAWNDLGNIVGRLSKKLGMKHGHAGLYYVQRDGDVVVKEHLLSNEYTKILEILELDIEHFKKGFNTEVEMFQWAGSSPYFDPEIFKFENLNHINRVRDRKRKTYNQLVEWCAKTYAPAQVRKDFPEKEKRLDFVLNIFPFIKEEHDRLEKEITLKREAALKFNGKIIMELIPKLSGKDLGSFITYFKSLYPSFLEYVLNTTEEDIRAHITYHYNNWINNA